MDLQKKLEETMKLKDNALSVYQQLIGRENMLRELLAEEQKVTKEEKKES